MEEGRAVGCVPGLGSWAQSHPRYYNSSFLLINASLKSLVDSQSTALMARLDECNRSYSRCDITEMLPLASFLNVAVRRQAIKKQSSLLSQIWPRSNISLTSFSRSWGQTSSLPCILLKSSHHSTNMATSYFSRFMFVMIPFFGL